MEKITPITLKNDIYEDSKLETETPAPLPKDYETFIQNYTITSKNILINDEYKLYEGESIKEKERVIIKEYNTEYTQQIESIDNLINLEYNYLIQCKNKLIIKIKDFYISKGKYLLILEYFDWALKDKYDKKYNLEQIRYFLIQINEIIKELIDKQIYDIVFSPENISISKENKIDDSFDIFYIKLINLFPYYFKNYKFKANCLKYGIPELQKDNEPNNKKNDFLEDSYIPYRKPVQKKMDKYLWNIGVLIYEMHFGEFPYEKDMINNEIIFKNFKKSESKDFDDLIINILKLDGDEQLNWNNYIHHKFFIKIQPEIFYKILYEKEKLKFDINMRGIDLGSSLIYNDNIEILSKIKFKNLIWINLSKNKIRNLEFLNGDAFSNLKLFIIEENYITQISSSNNNISFFFF